MLRSRVDSLHTNMRLVWKNLQGTDITLFGLFSISKEKSFMTANVNLRGRLSTIDLRINVAGLVKKKEKYLQLEKGANLKLVRTRRSTVLSCPFQ